MGKPLFLSIPGMKGRRWHWEDGDHLDQKRVEGGESAVIPARMKDAFKLYDLNTLGFFLFILAKKNIYWQWS